MAKGREGGCVEPDLQDGVSVLASSTLKGKKKTNWSAGAESEAIAGCTAAVALPA